MYVCQCDCGNVKTIRGNNLLRGNKSCGNCNNISVGDRFGMLSVVEESDKKSADNHKMYVCKCDCGKLTCVIGSKLKSGDTKSCGCIKYSVDGESGSRLYNVWKGMISRCYNKNDKSYCNYGERGISVCDEWINSYLSFRDWANENGYDKYANTGECTIDRIDNSIGYSPSNCRFVDNITQQNNRRNNRFINAFGKNMTIAQWSRYTNIPYETIRKNINNGVSPESFLTA